MSPVRVLAASPEHLLGIMMVEDEKRGTFDERAIVGWERMADRIERCNTDDHTWFWVAVAGDEIVGYIVLQPTWIAPEHGATWSTATDHGTLYRTFDPDGDNLYVVAMGVRADASRETWAMLFWAAFRAWRESGKRCFMACTRMPGFASAYGRTGVTADEYWRLRRGDGTPVDASLRLFHDLLGGVDPLRMLPKNCPNDHASGGHGVLFAAYDPARALYAAASMARAWTHVEEYRSAA